MTKKLSIILVVILLASAFMAACTAAPGAGGTKLKVGLVTDTGGVNDKSFNQSAWAGVQKAMKDLGVDAKFIESKQPTDYDKNIDQFATENYNVIVTVGFLMGDCNGCQSQTISQHQVRHHRQPVLPHQGFRSLPGYGQGLLC